jgi:hypothetical protein
MDNQISLSEPVELLFIEIYRDGGTIALGLQGTEGGGLSFSVDGSLGSRTPNRIYLNLDTPNGNKSVLVPRGDERERRIVELLQGWLANNFSPEEINELRGSYGTRRLEELERNGALCISAVDMILS